MSRLPHFVSLHPYFKAHPGEIERFKARLPEFISQTASEQGNLFYDFTIHGDEIFCREGYLNAEALLRHLNGVDPLLQEVMKIADLTRIEVHGPTAELENLKESLAQLKPVWFTLHD